MKVVSVLQISLVLVFFLVLMSRFHGVAVLGEIGPNEAALALVNAEGAVDSAFRTVLEVEQAGADVSGLLDQLNRAGEYLTLAYTAYKQGDFGKAADFASSSRNAGNEVEEVAVELKNSAFLTRLQRAWFLMISSTLCVILVSVGSFLAWRVFKRFHHRKVLGMKPEVVSREP